MGKYVVIVESPTKAKTLTQYLGTKDYTILASYGHVRDLLPKTGAVTIEDNHCLMTYTPIEKNSAHVKKIVTALKKADTLILATDPDREGEAIAWHLLALLKEKKALKKGTIVQRAVFHQITKSAIQEAIATPRDISIELVNAQQARRALDYLVGFNLSPLLWRKIKPGLSAGRVQSPALRMIVERELEIEAFEPQEYWSIHAHTQDIKIETKLVRYEGEKLHQYSINNETQANEVQSNIDKKAQGTLTVGSITERPRSRKPAAPFTTATLQQDAGRKLGFSTSKTMMVAQQLYEGIEYQGEQMGLITYMRTDSVFIASEAIDALRTWIKKHHPDTLPEQPISYKVKAKNAQEAHEAIRPSHIHLTPDDLKKSLTDDQLKLYRLIWYRTVASQMKPAIYQMTSVLLDAYEGTQFKATGSRITFPGFTAIYKISTDRDVSGEEEQNDLPKLSVGQELNIDPLITTQHFTEPPPRFTEASLVKALVEYGIGRPSTYASIIATLKQRAYVVLEKKRFEPTDMGRIVNKFLTEHFTQYVDYDFTAGLEDALDKVACNEENWEQLIIAFWGTFHKQVEHIAETVTKRDVTQELLDEKCPDCGEQLAKKLGKSGYFIGCTNYPDCKHTRSLEEDGSEDITIDHDCPKCQSTLILRHGRYGPFIGCSAYPKCKHIEPLKKPNTTDVTCPKCNEGSMVEKQSRRGAFYACNKYPKCRYAISNEPTKTSCPKCSWPMMMKKSTKTKGDFLQCPECKHADSES